MKNMINATQTIGQIAGRRPATIEVFEQFGIHYCCHGEDTLEAACAAIGLDQEVVLSELNHAADTSLAAPSLWTDPILESLIGHLCSNTELLLHRNLPRIQKLARAVGSCPTHRHSQPREVARLARKLVREISSHIAQESEMLFPAIQNIEQAYVGEAVLRTVPASVRHSIAQMERSHEAIGALLSTLRRLTGDFDPGDSDCAPYRALCNDLKLLDREIRLEVHLENNVLYDRARQLSQALCA
jgi:regulator of cell morphogenesis and NO signaling